MDFFGVVAARRSIRSFSGREVPRASIEACLHAARLAPSGSNAQPWRFLVVRSPETLALLAEAGYNQPCFRQVPVVTVLMGDRGLYRKRLRRARELADVGALSPENVALLEEHYRRRSGAREDNDTGIAANCMLAGEHYVLAAASHGLGTCWVMLFDKDKVAEILGLDRKNNFPVALIPTGFPSGGTIPPRPRYALTEIAWEERVESPWREEKEK